MKPNPPARQGTLRIDPVACAGIGMCAHLAPGLIALDQWGFPVLPHGGIEGDDTRPAIRAVRGCPRKALLFSDNGAA